MRTVNFTKDIDFFCFICYNGYVTGVIFLKTVIYKVEDTERDGKYIKACAEILKKGGLVAFPTETVYGLGANALDVSAVEKLYAAKNRPPAKPFSVCVADLPSAERVAVFDDRAKLLFKTFMPGPLTIVLPKKETVPDLVTAGLDTVGIRVPANDIAMKLLKLSGVPLALPSANISGKGSLSDGAEVVKELYGRVDAIIDAGKTSVGTVSTIVSLVDETKILRVGAVPPEKIMQLVK